MGGRYGDITMDDRQTDIMQVLSYMALAEDKLDEISYKGADTEALQQMLRDASDKIYTALIPWRDGETDGKRIVVTITIE